MAGLRPQELLIVLLIVLVLFGGKKLPDLARSLGGAQKEFKKALDEGSSDDTQQADAADDGDRPPDSDVST